MVSIDSFPSQWWASMTSADTPNAGRCWWGWGQVSALAAEVRGEPAVRPLGVAEAARQLRAPRVPLRSLPADLQAICTDHPFERLLHSRGRDFVDIVRNLGGPPSNGTDLVAFPATEAQVAALLDHCSKQGIAVVPFGAGSSVAFGVNPPEDSDGYQGTITVDMLRFDKVLEVDEVSMCARVQAGVYGPSLEKQLKARGFTLRYFPQSFEFSTVGGWIVTRGGGHFATGPTHIDDMVESVRLVAPAGTTETRRLPSSGAGPAEHRLYLGSEGVLGIVTEAWLKVRREPVTRASATVLFRAANADEAFLIGSQAVRCVVQTGLQPANLRLIYGAEVERMTRQEGIGDAAVLLLGFEAAEEGLVLQPQLQLALDLCARFGGETAGGAGAAVRSGGGGEREGIAGKFGAGFMRGGYTFSALALTGLLVNTFETAVTWDRFFGGFQNRVLEATRNALKEVCGGGTVTCRFTHVYPDGPAPYYTILAPGRSTPVDERAEQWLKVKAAVMEAVLEHGGTATHHHSVGKLHRGQFQREQGALYGGTLEAVKQRYDPAWVLNPGVLLESTRRSRL